MKWISTLFKLILINSGKDKIDLENNNFSSKTISLSQGVYDDEEFIYTNNDQLMFMYAEGDLFPFVTKYIKIVSNSNNVKSIDKFIKCEFAMTKIKFKGLQKLPPFDSDMKTTLECYIEENKDACSECLFILSDK